MAILDLNPAAELDIKIAAGHSWDITFSGDADGPEVFANAAPSMRVVRGGGPVATYNTENGMEVVNSRTLRISRNVVQNSLPAGEYSYNIRLDYGNGTSLPFAAGKLIIEKA